MLLVVMRAESVEEHAGSAMRAPRVNPVRVKRPTISRLGSPMSPPKPRSHPAYRPLSRPEWGQVKLIPTSGKRRFDSCPAPDYFRAPSQRLRNSHRRPSAGRRIATSLPGGETRPGGALFWISVICAGKRIAMQQRARMIGLIRLAMGASILLPCLIFSVASWETYKKTNALADERLIRSLDVQQEQAQKALQLVELALNNANDLTAELSETDIRDAQEHIHLQFKNIVSNVPMVQSIWIYGADGRALVTSWVRPPPSQSVADYDFFAAHADGENGL